MKMSLRELIEQHDTEFNEKYKDVKCTFQGCILWGDCLKCNGFKDDHIKDCKMFALGWMQAISELTGNVAPY